MVCLTSRCLAILALLTVGPGLWVRAQDAEAPAPAEEKAEGGGVKVEEGAAGEGGEGGEGQTDEEKGQAFADSAKELQEKLAQLRALLDAKGEGADPGLKEKLAGLESQLKGLGLEELTGGGTQNSPELQ